MYKIYAKSRCAVADSNTIWPMQLQLPEPAAEALAASETLRHHITNDIRMHDGWISFARYMELVLYTPQWGYYSGGAAKLGAEGDFTTAPEITPLFGATLAHLAADLMAQTDVTMLEFGAGTGKLAFDILTELAAIDRLPATYAIIELSGQLRERQKAALKDFPQVVWLDALPDAFTGVIVGNEVLDAMPVNLVLKSETGWLERGVGLNEAGQFVFVDRPGDAGLVAQIPDADVMPVGYLTEVHPVAAGFMQSVAHMIGRGKGAAALFVDYGFPAHEYYFDERNTGTVMCHYRHHAHTDPFYLPGLQDITAHVDFTAMALAAANAGLDVLGYTSQAGFLLGAGLGELLLRTAPEDAKAYLPQSRAVQKLVSPAEMGELFKVLAVGKDVIWPERQLQHDRTHRL
jgi:SAM-dependent MidA family methyltransferase